MVIEAQVYHLDKKDARQDYDISEPAKKTMFQNLQEISICIASINLRYTAAIQKNHRR